MKVIQIGSLAISLKWVVLGIAILAGLIVIKIWLKHLQPKKVNKKIFDLVTNSLFWGLLIWKGSLLLLEPKLVMKSPLSVLYFTGGSKGLIIAIIFAGVYFIYKARKIDIAMLLTLQTVFIFSFLVTSVYHLMSLFLLDKDTIYHLFFGFLTLILLILSFLRKRVMSHPLILMIGLVGMLALGLYDSYKIPGEAKRDNQVNPNLKSHVLLEVGVQEGHKAPDFELKDLNGNMIMLSDLQGKKVILNFWATWCPPCKAEMPHMQEFHDDQKNNNVEILGVNLTTSEKNIGEIEEFVKDYGLSFPVLLDRNGEIGDTYQAITIPTSYVIDSRGIIRKKIIGPMDKNMMEELIANIE